MAWVARPLEPGEFDEFMRLDGRVFGIDYQPEDRASVPDRVLPERVRVVADGGRLVGVGAAFSFELTLPGGASVPAAGVTWVSVDATHRRSGVLTAVMGALHDDSADRGEPVQILTASEASIYSRFGYGVATLRRAARIERRQTSMRAAAPRGGRTFVVDDPEVVSEAYRRLWNECRQERAGMVSLSDAWWRFLLGPIGDRVFGGRRHHLAHYDERGTIDGIASYRFVAAWNDVGPSGTAHVDAVLSRDRVARAELWRALLGLDLAANIDVGDLPIDDPLPFLLENPRALRTTSIQDDLWLRPDDVARLLSTRTYECSGVLVLEVEGGRYRLEVDDHGRATCEVVSTSAPAASAREADLSMGRCELGAALLGAPVLTGLAHAGRVAPRDDAVLARADRLFRTSRLPWLGIRF